MLSDDELATLFQDLESDRVERKASIADPNKIRQAICAFANDLPDYKQPGVIFVGVNDDGTCANLDITDALLLRLANMKSDGNILPFPTMSVQKHAVADCKLVAIVVRPSESPPVRFNGRTWIRVGPRRDTASSDDERRLSEKRVAGDRTFDQRPVIGTSLSDLDLTLFERQYLPLAIAPEVLAENERTIEQQLASLRLLTPDGIPTAAAVLLLCYDPGNWIPGDYIQFVRFDGVEMTDDVLNRREVTGPLSDQLRKIEELMETSIVVPTDVSGVVETRHPDYPMVTLQQIVRNALIHRNYESSNAPVRVYWFRDRVEIHSPGGPYGQVTPENFGQPGITDYRNPVIAEAAHTLGYVQRFGMGIALARKALAQNGNPQLEIETSGTAVAVTIRK